MRWTLLLAAVAAFAAAAAEAHEVTVPTTIENFPLDRVSGRVYVVHGPQELPSPATRGFMNNPGAILTDRGVIIVDPGSSVEIGRQMLEKVRAVTDKPVIAVFNTHVHGDHWLGNQAIQAAYPDAPIFAHARMIERVNAGEGQDWIDRFMRMTEGAVAGTKVVGPTVGLQGGETLNLGGVSLRIHHAGRAHTDHDLMIEVDDDKTIFLGDIVANRRVPSSDVPQDAYFKGQMRAIRTALATGARHFIPGHGRSGGREVPLASLRFLEILYGSVQRHYELGMSDFEMKDEVAGDLAEFRDWNNFNELGRVISYLYLEIEAESF
jgi:glyoxylase-like metal-dependent hydrolase (beta-lactamase superfamily II)